MERHAGHTGRNNSNPFHLGGGDARGPQKVNISRNDTKSTAITAEGFPYIRTSVEFSSTLAVTEKMLIESHCGFCQSRKHEQLFMTVQRL